MSQYLWLSHAFVKKSKTRKVYHLIILQLGQKTVKFHPRLVKLVLKHIRPLEASCSNGHCGYQLPPLPITTRQLEGGKQRWWCGALSADVPRPAGASTAVHAANR